MFTGFYRSGDSNIDFKNGVQIFVHNYLFKKIDKKQIHTSYAAHWYNVHSSVSNKMLR